MRPFGYPNYIRDLRVTVYLKTKKISRKNELVNRMILYVIHYSNLITPAIETEEYHVKPGR
jgi:hypothetical protein